MVYARLQEVSGTVCVIDPQSGLWQRILIPVLPSPTPGRVEAVVLPESLDDVTAVTSAPASAAEQGPDAVPQPAPSKASSKASERK